MEGVWGIIWSSIIIQCVRRCNSNLSCRTGTKPQHLLVLPSLHPLTSQRQDSLDQRYIRELDVYNDRNSQALWIAWQSSSSSNGCHFAESAFVRPKYGFFLTTIQKSTTCGLLLLGYAWENSIVSAREHVKSGTSGLLLKELYFKTLTRKLYIRNFTFHTSPKDRIVLT